MDAAETNTRLNAHLVAAGLAPLDEATAGRFESYSSLFIRWNQRLNLSAVRDEEGILSRHFTECIAAARALPEGIRTLLDFGSGAGLPGIPIALCRPEIAVTLAESQTKKAAFLEEAIRVLKIRTKVHAQRAEVLRTVFDCVILRAVDKMTTAVAAAAKLVAPKGWLALMTTSSDLDELSQTVGGVFHFATVVPLPGSTQRVLAIGRRAGGY
jgi:16S rRNA (guanine527-N7)-methyltransferase